VNNFVWAYNIDDQSLVRVLSITAGGEATGLQYAEDINGYSYLMTNAQHLGAFTSSTSTDITSQIWHLIDAFDAPIGYVGAIPAIGSSN